jgi:hypothetical protein
MRGRHGIGRDARSLDAARGARVRVSAMIRQMVKADWPTLRGVVAAKVSMEQREGCVRLIGKPRSFHKKFKFQKAAKHRQRIGVQL